jgi:hypothetical protein
MKPLIPYLITHWWDLMIAIFGLAAGLIYALRPDWVGNYRGERDRTKFRWFGLLFIAAGIGLLFFLMVGYFNSN